MKKGTKITLIIIAVLVAIRIALPFVIVKYVNKVLGEIEGYTGSIDDVDLALYRGAYQIHGLNLFSVEKEIKTPFVAIETIDISVEWKALFEGSIVGEIILEKPVLNFAAGPGEEEVQTGEENDWTKTITDLIPLQINRFEINDGRIAYLDDYSEPKVNVYFNNFNAIATNLNNSKDSESELPSKVMIRSSTIGDGSFKVDMDINILKEIPDFDANLSIEKLNIPALNDFFKAYANFDAEEGEFNLYTEMALLDKQLDGYVKPVIKDLKILDWKNEEENFWGKMWEALVGLGGNVLENPKKDQIGTKVPISGKIDDTSIGTWKAITVLLKNAFIKPLQKQIDQTIKVDQSSIINKDDKKKKKE